MEFTLVRFPDAEITVLYACGLEETGEGVRQRTLRNEFEAAEQPNRTVSTALEYGRPIRAIVTYAEDHEIDRIVIGTHDRRGLSRLLLGSVAETVMRRSSVPVTVHSIPGRD